MKLATKFKPTDEAAFATAVAAGFQCAEFWLGADLLRQTPNLERQARQYPMQYALHFPNKGDLDSDHLNSAVDLYFALDARAMVIHQPMFRKHGSLILDIDADVRLAVENHRLDLEGFRQWANENEWLTLDVEHVWKYTLCDCPLSELSEFLGDFLDQFAAKLAHVHLPGYLPGLQEHRPMYCNRDMVFTTLSLLADHDYDGFVVSEVNQEFQNAEELRMDTLLLERWQQISSGDASTGSSKKRVA